MPADPVILSNISSAKYELGDYEGCLATLQDISTTGSVLRNTKKWRLLLLRKVKCLLYLQRFDECMGSIEDLLGDSEVEKEIADRANHIYVFIKHQRDVVEKTSNSDTHNAQLRGKKDLPLYRPSG